MYTKVQLSGIHHGRAQANALAGALAGMRTCWFLAFVLLAASLSAVTAGCYRNGYKPAPVPEDELSYNHDPLPIQSPEFLPKAWNWCDVAGVDMCAGSWNQHIPIYCGSCWAHGTLSMIQDRLKIRKKGRGTDVMLARQTLLNCAAFEGYGGGCDGGDPIDVFRYMKKFGLPDESCMLYNATDHTKFKGAKHCPDDAICRNCMPVNDVDTCWAVKNPINYKLTSYGKVSPPGEQGMMSEIFFRGPIVCSITTSDAFVYKYRGGIYRKDKSKKSEIDHNVEVVGWGEEDGVKFWRVRNSWGTFWGEMGFFRVERGTNALFIEGDDCWYAEPEFHMEDEILAGKLEGSMYGLVENDSQGAPVAASSKVHLRLSVA